MVLYSPHLCRPVKKKKANAQALQNVLRDLDKYKERKRRFEGSKAAQAAVAVETPPELDAVFEQDTAAEEPAPVPEPPVHGQCVLPVQVGALHSHGWADRISS